MDRKDFRGTVEIKADGEPGSFRAVFAYFNTIDKDGDVTRPDAFEKGARVRVAAWQHNWGALTVGKGVIDFDDEKVWIDGRFNLATEIGREHYETIKFNEDLQEWSYGFDIEEKEFGPWEGTAVRFLNRMKVHEVSPVMVGAGNGTHTEAIKSGGLAVVAEAKYYDDDDDYFGQSAKPPKGSYEYLAKQLQGAFKTAMIPPGMYGYAMIVGTFPDKFIACMYRSDMDGYSYWETPYTMSSSEKEGDNYGIELGDPVKVEAQTTFVPAKGAGLSYNEHAVWVGHVVSEFAERTKTGVDIRVGEGRKETVTAARRDRITVVSGSLRQTADELDKILKAASPEPAGSVKRVDVLRARTEFERLKRSRVS